MNIDAIWKQFVVFNQRPDFFQFDRINIIAEKDCVGIAHGHNRHRHDLSAYLQRIVDDRAGTPPMLRGKRPPVQDFRCLVREPAQHDRRLGAADVDTDECLHPPSQTEEECSTEQRQRTASEDPTQGAAGETSTSLMRSQLPKRWRSHIETPSDTTKPM